MNARRIYLTTAATQGFLLSLVFTISQIYRITRVGLTPLQLVLVGTTLEITAFVFEIPTGIVADVFSRKLSIIIGFLLFGVGFIVEGAFPIFAAVLLAQVIWGLGWTFISGAHEAWIADEVGVDNVGQVYMRGTQYYHFGNLLGIPLSVFFGKMALNLPILIGGGFFIAYGIFLSLFMPENEFTPAGSETRQTWKTMRSTLFNGIKMMRSQSVLMIFLAIAFFVGLYSEGFDRLQEAHFLSNFAFPLPELIDSVTWFGIMRLGTILLTLVATEIVKRKITANAHIKYTRLLQIIYGVIVVPQIFNTVPRLLEKVYDNFIKKGKDLTGIKKIIYFWAVKVAHQYKYPGKNSWWYERKQRLADKLIFKHWRTGLGGNIKIIVSGGSALQERLIRIFWAAGLPVYEGYGLTETSPVIAVNDPRDYKRVRFGSVGPILENLEVKIADDGEILCKGPSVMMGYYKDEEQTKETISEDGWLHTGDIGILEDGIFLTITDRKKEIFKNSAGKYIAPQVIENKLKESSLIEQAMVVGENEKFASALISPNLDYLHTWAAQHKIHFEDNKDLVQNKEIVARMHKEVNKVNKNLGQVEQIKRFRMVCDSWSPESGELSPTLKLKRKEIYAKYDHILSEIYSVGDKN